MNPTEFSMNHIWTWIMSIQVWWTSLILEPYPYGHGLITVRPPELHRISCSKSLGFVNGYQQELSLGGERIFRKKVYESTL